MIMAVEYCARKGSCTAYWSDRPSSCATLPSVEMSGMADVCCARRPSDPRPRVACAPLRRDLRLRTPADGALKAEADAAHAKASATHTAVRIFTIIACGTGCSQAWMRDELQLLFLL